ncbi:MAG: hypothetical protein PHS80_00215 [Methanothrix sp.]|nr:hypothetical protein [Methanothrix sp.]
MVARVDRDDFIALTGTSLSTTIVDKLLEAADRAVNTETERLGNPSISESTLYDASMLFAKAMLADLCRLDGTFDVSTNGYSHKGNTESMITGYRDEAKSIIKNEARVNAVWLQKANR